MARASNTTAEAPITGSEEQDGLHALAAEIAQDQHEHERNSFSKRLHEALHPEEEGAGGGSQH